MIRLRKKKKIEFWNGRPDHPFFGLLSARIDSIGFRWKGVTIDDEASIAAWRRPLFHGYSLELSLLAEHPKYLGEGYFGFDPTLFVVSDRQTEIWNRYRIWDCYNLAKGSAAKAEEGAIAILAINLRWLARAWDSKSLPEWSMPTWHKVAQTEATNCADRLAQFVTRQLPRLMELTSTPEALVRTLLNLEIFPGKDDGNGPLSAARNIFTSILLHDLGRTEEAIKELMLSELQDAAAVNRGMDPQHLETTRCQIARLLHWMNGGDSLPPSSPPDYLPA